MIQIQIAGGLSEQGVSDICWVLLDPADPVAPPLVEAAAAVPITLPASPTHRVVTDRRAAAARSSQVTQAVDEPRPLRADARGERSDDPSAGKAELVHQVLRLLVLAAALVGAWWLASAKLQSTAPPLAQWAVPSSKPPLSAPVSRP